MPDMTTCGTCGTSFDAPAARAQCREEFGSDDYDDVCAGEDCGDCSVSTAESNYGSGLAIMMMNGDADYDEEHVERYL